MLLFLFLLVRAEVPVDQDRLKWSAQAEGAAVKLKLQAQDLSGWAERVGREGRVGWLPVLRSSSSELVRRAELLERVVGLQNAMAASPEGDQPGAEPENAPE